MTPLAILSVMMLTAAGGLIWFFGGEAPAEVDLAVTASSVATEEPASGDESITGIEGVWSVDTTVGSFTLEDTTTATFVGFRVEEVLNSVGSATAVGRTPDVAGSIVIEDSTLIVAEIDADLSSIVSDEARRDDAVQRTLGTSTNPRAAFELTDPVELAEQAARGEVISVTATGDLTISGVTNEVEIDLEAQLIEGMVLVTGTTRIDLADYGISPPTAPVVLSVEDHGIIEIQLWLSR